MKEALVFIVTIVISYFSATPVGKWFDKQYPGGGGWVYAGSFPGFLDGLVFSYIFFASLFFPQLTGKIKSGLYSILPVLVIEVVLGAWNPQLWMSLIFLASGLGFSSLILLAQKHLRS